MRTHQPCLSDTMGVFHLPSDGDRTADDFVLQHDADDKEDEIEQEHNEAQDFAHLPFAGSDGHDDKQEHEEEEDNGTEQTVAAHSHWPEVIDGAEDEPGEGQTGGTQDRRRDVRQELEK